jgi:hypothetical protein
MRLLLCLLAALSALVCGTEASAAQFLYTITGQVVLDELSYDERQLFGPTLGSTFTAGFVVDDAVAQAIYDYGPTSSSATGGWASAPGTLPPITASLTIGGGTYAVRQGNSSSGPMISPDGEPFGGTSSQRDLGAIRKDAVARRLDLTTSYYEESFCCYPAGYQFEASGDYLDFGLYSAAFTNPDYRQLGTYAVAPTGGYFSSFVQTGPYPGAMTQIRFTAERLTVSSLSAVPEIGTWLMMIAGVACAGSSKRRRGQPRQTSLTETRSRAETHSARDAEA